MRWIPVTERLPNKQDDYLVTIPLDNNSTYVDVLHFHKGKFYDTDSEWGDIEYDDVLAWMPLPEPYKSDRKTEPRTIRCPKCGRTDYIRDMEKDMGIKGSCYEYKCINCNTYIKTEPQTEAIQISPQTDIGTSDTVYSDTAGYVPRVDMTDCSWK